MKSFRRRGLFGAAALPWPPTYISAPSGGSADSSAPVTSYDMIGDGKSHPLSERFETLQQARIAYPQALSLSDEIDWCAMQKILDEADSRGGGAVYVRNTGASYILNRQLSINTNRVTVRGDGSVLDFSRLRGRESAILFRGDGVEMYGHERHVFEGFELIGSGRADVVAGLLFRTSTEGRASRAQVRDCAIHGFHVGVLFGDRAYGIGFEHVSVYDCSFCIFAPYNLRDAGETVSFSQCYLFNSGCLISNGCGFDLKFFGCSFDYAERIVWDNNGIIDLVGCRVEISPPTAPPFHCNGGRLNMFGGFFLVNGGRDVVQAQELFALSNPSATVHLFAVSGWNWKTLTGKLTNGPGKIYWYEGREITTTPASVGSP